MDTQSEYTLEELVDQYGIREILEALASICDQKAEHIRASYDDNTLADAWRDDAIALRKCDAGDQT